MQTTKLFRLYKHTDYNGTNLTVYYVHFLSHINCNVTLTMYYIIILSQFKRHTKLIFKDKTSSLSNSQGIALLFKVEIL